MKKSILISILLLGTILAFGQSGKIVGKLDYKITNLVESLDLTAGQQEKVTILFETNRFDSNKGQKAFVRMNDLEKEARLSEIETKKLAIQAGMEEILTPQQLVKYKQKADYR